MPPKSRRSRTTTPAGTTKPQGEKLTLPRVEEIDSDEEVARIEEESRRLEEIRRGKRQTSAEIIEESGEPFVLPHGRTRRHERPAGYEDHPESPDSSDNLPPAELKKHLEQKLKALQEENEILDLRAAIRSEKRKARGELERELFDPNPQLSDQIAAPLRSRNDVQHHAERSQPRSLPRLKPPPLTKWAGTGGLGKLNEWLHSFDDHFDYMSSGGEMDDSDKIRYAVMHLERTAHKTWHGDKQAGKLMPATWKTFETWCRDLCEHPSTRGANTAERWINARQGENQDVLSFLAHLQDLEADLFADEEMSEPARVKVAKARLLSGIRWELNRSDKEIVSYASLRAEASRLENILKDQRKAAGTKDQMVGRKPSDRNLKKRGLSTSQGEGSSQRDGAGAPKDAKRSKGDTAKLPYGEYQNRREKNLCFSCGGPGHRASDCKLNKDRESKTKEDVSKETPASGHKARMARVASLPPLRPRESRTRGFEIDIVVETASGVKHTLRALIDSGADVSFISHKTVRRLLDWNLPQRPVATVECINGSEAPLYGNHLTSIVTVDSEGTSKRYQHSFAAIHMVGVDVLLGLEWLEQVNPHTNWVEKSWRYRYEPEDMEVVSVGKFLRAVSKGGEAYLATPQLLADPADGIPDWLEDYQDVFSEEGAAELPPVDGASHAIDLKEGAEPPYMPIYNLSQKELETLRKYLEDSIGKGWIRESKSPAGAPVLFAPKADGSLRLCVDYRGLNSLTIKNRYPLPLIDEMLDRLQGARFFTKLDLRDAYHRIRIREGDEWKTAFRTRYGHFEYLVMPFGLANAPATFQAYINRALSGLLDVCCVVYLDDILVYSRTQEEHRRNVTAVLGRLREYRLFAKLSKCSFETTSVSFLGFIVDIDGVRMDTERVRTIDEWPVPRSFKDIQIFLGFTNFYRRFIFRYSVLTAPITDLLKGMQNGKKTGPFLFTREARKAFDELKAAFRREPLLRHFDPQRPIRLETDASLFAAGAVLSQPWDDSDGNGKQWHPIAFWSFKFESAECNYGTPDQEMLAIVRAFKHWRQYLEGALHPVEVMTDHANLRSFMQPTTKIAQRRHVRWIEFLAGFDFEILYRTGKSNPADGPSRRPDYKRCEEDIGLPTFWVKQRWQGRSSHPWDPWHESPTVVGNGKPVAHLRATRTRSATAALLEESRSSHKAEQAQADSDTTVDVSSAEDEPLETGGDEPVYLSPRLSVKELTRGETAFTDSPSRLRERLLDLQRGDAFAKEKVAALEKSNAGQDWEQDGDQILRFEGAIYIPNDPALRNELLRIHHDDPMAGHFGVKKMLGLLRRKYYWPSMRKSIEAYCRTCQSCQKGKPRTHAPYGTLASLPQPTRPWTWITMDFITDLPSCTVKGKEVNAILVVVDRYTKMAKYLHCRKDIDTPELASLLFDGVFSQYGFPTDITSDRGAVFTSNYWSQLCYHMRIKRNLSTAYHPQTDGQTEVQNRTLEMYLRLYCNYRQDDWVDWLPYAEFAYNNSVQSSTGETPFYVLMGYHPRWVNEIYSDLVPEEAPVASRRAKMLHAMRRVLTERYERSMEHMAKFYDRKRKPHTFAPGDKVLLSTRNLRTTRPSKKLDNRGYGPFEVEETVGTHAYRLALPHGWRIHPVFHVTQLEPFHRREGEEPEQPPPIIIDENEEWEVEEVLDERTHYKKKQYLVKWKGFEMEDSTWQTEKDLANAQTALRTYKKNRKAAGEEAVGRSGRRAPKTR